MCTVAITQLFRGNKKYVVQCILSQGLSHYRQTLKDERKNGLEKTFTHLQKRNLIGRVYAVEYNVSGSVKKLG
jgi:hypothetical protein